MSFGFGVGDIISLSELAYKIYGYLHYGRREAPEAYHDIESAVFGLRCALEHLATTAAKASGAAISSEMQSRLSLMISNCAATLEAIKEFLDRYPLIRDDGGGTVNIAGSGGPTPPKTTPTKTGLRFRMRMSVQKIGFGVKQGKELLELRDRVRSHTDAINLVVSTFVWSAVIQSGVEDKAQSAALQSLRETVLQEGQAMASLVEDLKGMMIDARATAQQSQSLRDGPGLGRPPPVAAPIVFAATPIPPTGPAGDQAAGFFPEDPDHWKNAETTAPSLQSLNNERRIQGRQSYERRTGGFPHGKRAAAAIAIPQDLPPLMPDRANSNDISQINSLSCALVWVSNLQRSIRADFGPECDPTPSKKEKQRKLLETLASMNTAIRTLDSERQAVLVSHLEAARIREVLDMAKKLSKTVMVAKEVSVYLSKAAQVRLANVQN